jgi:hypothetical protein
VALKGNIVIDQGTTFSTTIDVTNEDGLAIDLTGYTGAAQMRKHYTSTTAYTFTVTIAELSGEVTLSMTANATANIAPGRYMYDCELTDTLGTVSRIVEGIVTVTPGVTR